MVSNYWRLMSWPLLVTALGLPVLMDCGGMPKGADAPNITGGPSNSHDLANREAVATRARQLRRHGKRGYRRSVLLAKGIQTRCLRGGNAEGWARRRHQLEGARRR